MNKYDKIDLEGIPASEVHNRVRELLDQAKKRDAGKVPVKHPTLPNTWLMVSPEKAKILTQSSHE